MAPTVLPVGPVVGCIKTRTCTAAKQRASFQSSLRFCPCPLPVAGDLESSLEYSLNSCPFSASGRSSISLRVKSWVDRSRPRHHNTHRMACHAIFRSRPQQRNGIRFYNNLQIRGTAKVRVSRTRHRSLWVEKSRIRPLLYPSSIDFMTVSGLLLPFLPRHWNIATLQRHDGAT
jgi:hypothetical protein